MNTFEAISVNPYAMSVNPYIDYSWSKELETVGFDLYLRNGRITLNSYAIPVHKYSSGGSVSWSFSEFFVGSEAYNRVASVFSSSVAENILQIVQRNPVSEKNLTNEKQRFNNWLKDRVEVNNLLKIWKSRPHYTWCYSYNPCFKNLPIVKEKSSDGVVKYYSKKTRALLFTGSSDTQIQFVQIAGNREAILFDQSELIVIHEILDENVQTYPLEDLSKLLKTGIGKLNGIMSIGELLFVSFSAMADSDEINYYLIALNPGTGKIVYQKTN